MVRYDRTEKIIQVQFDLRAKGLSGQPGYFTEDRTKDGRSSVIAN